MFSVSSIPHFYHHPGTLRYSFGPNHPLKPEQLRRTLQLLERFEVEPVQATEAKVHDLQRVHDPEYVAMVQHLSQNPSLHNLSDDDLMEATRFGFTSGDNPPFAGMYEAACAYTGATIKAAEVVRDGAMLAFGIGGGLHHAQRALASGFCIFDDAAIACSILRDKFQRVAYVDIDVHHGDGVQWIFYKDPTILTCSIHEEGRTLFPGTGFAEEVGEGNTSLNVPLQARTTADIWIDAFERGILPGIETFEPQAIVLQLGTDTHALDPLGHIKSDAQSWLKAIKRIKELGLPIVAVGGGGYNLDTVPRMWSAACLTLGGIEFEDQIPSDLAKQWGVSTFLDPSMQDQEVGKDYANGIIEWVERNVHSYVGK